MRSTWCALSCALVVCAACGGSAKNAPEPQMPEKAPPASAPSMASPPPPPAQPSMQPGGAPGADGAPNAAPSQYATPPGDVAATRKNALEGARRDFERAQRELDIGGSDCALACRALGSMDRATSRLCEAAASEGDRARCEDAKAALKRALERVRSACGTCPKARDTP